MSTQNNDGGPAFPQIQSTLSDGSAAYIQDSCAGITSSGGMSLRDYFAVKADISWSAVISTLELKEKRTNFTVGEVLQQRAAMKFAEADAMLAARKEASK